MRLPRKRGGSFGKRISGRLSWEMLRAKQQRLRWEKVAGQVARLGSPLKEERESGKHKTHPQTPPPKQQLDLNLDAIKNIWSKRNLLGGKRGEKEIFEET